MVICSIKHAFSYIEDLSLIIISTNCKPFKNILLYHESLKVTFYIP